MAQDASQIRVGANGSIYVAPYGTTAPTHESSSLAAGFVELGLVNEEGAKFKDSKTTRDQTAWQSFYAVGQKIVSREGMAGFALKQWNKVNVQLAFGGGTVTTISAGHYKYEPPAPETIDYRAMVIDWVDGNYHYRLYIPRGMAADDVEIGIVRTSDMDLAVGFKITPADNSTKPWTLFTDDPAFA